MHFILSVVLSVILSAILLPCLLSCHVSFCYLVCCIVYYLVSYLVSCLAVVLSVILPALLSAIAPYLFPPYKWFPVILFYNNKYSSNTNTTGLRAIWLVFRYFLQTIMAHKIFSANNNDTQNISCKQ